MVKGRTRSGLTSPQGLGAGTHEPLVFLILLPGLLLTNGDHPWPISHMWRLTLGQAQCLLVKNQGWNRALTQGCALSLRSLLFASL